MKQEIINLLNEIECDNNVEIIYACESGSRVWGFSNEDSDWDVRFIYKRNGIDDYITLKTEKEVIEITKRRIDIVGWDIRKALNLHFKSNPTLREWLISDQIYINRNVEGLFDGLGDFDKNVLKHHYKSMAFNHWKKYCRGEFEKRKCKKYLYVIRCILSWSFLDNGSYPPLNIHDLLKDSTIKNEVETLIEYYQNSTVIDERTINILNQYIETYLNIMNRDKSKPKIKKSYVKYGDNFKKIIKGD